MPFIDAGGDLVEKGGIARQTKTFDVSSNDIDLDASGQTTVTLEGLVSITNVIDVSLSEEQVDTSASDGEALAATVVSTSDNTVTLQFHLEQSGSTITTAGTNSLNANYGLDQFTVTVEGY